MILRRVIEHVKAQNWFAVALDFVIVVVGPANQCQFRRLCNTLIDGST